jgi:small neutral amino acid transporter SnatA (MarC family)
MRAWLIRRNRLIMGVLCVALGVVMVLKGVAAF